MTEELWMIFAAGVLTGVAVGLVLGVVLSQERKGQTFMTHYRYRAIGWEWKFAEDGSARLVPVGFEHLNNRL